MAAGSVKKRRMARLWRVAALQRVGWAPVCGVSIRQDCSERWVTGRALWDPHLLQHSIPSVQASFDPPGITVAVKKDRAMEPLLVVGGKVGRRGGEVGAQGC